MDDIWAIDMTWCRSNFKVNQVASGTVSGDKCDIRILRQHLSNGLCSFQLLNFNLCSSELPDRLIDQLSSLGLSLRSNNLCILQLLIPSDNKLLPFSQLLLHSSSLNGIRIFSTEAQMHKANILNVNIKLLSFITQLRSYLFTNSLTIFQQLISII